MNSSALSFDGILFFPVTPFDDRGDVDLDVLARHLEARIGFEPGAVFAACGTGEFHALSAHEASAVVRRSVSVIAGRAPVVAGVGGPLGHALECAVSAAEAGADALLVMPPYLVTGPIEGTIAYVEAVVAAVDLQVIVYHRANARLTPRALSRLLEHPRVIGFKDGIGDVGVAQELVLAARETGRDDLQLFNGALTAELSQGGYRGLGIPLYSSAAFAMAPAVATAYYRAYSGGDEQARLDILSRFYAPLVRLRDETPGFGVSLVKAGLRLRGLPVGSVRPPLVDPDQRQENELKRILAIGDRIAEGS